jgi:ferredoxin
MPTVSFHGEEIECEENADLRAVLLDAAESESPHNGPTQYLNCGGRAMCGTCAVDVDGDVSDPTAREERRLSLPPHDRDAGLRLACQTRVQGDVDVRKHRGFWGQHVDRTEK